MVRPSQRPLVADVAHREPAQSGPAVLESNSTGQLILCNPNRYFDTVVFTTSLAGTWGNAPRNFSEGPGLTTTDLSLAKKFLFTERFKLQFRAEVLNILNHTNLNTSNPAVSTLGSTDPTKPLTPLASSTAGVITTTSSRQIQFGLKLLW